MIVKISLPVLSLFCTSAFAQNIGINLATPVMPVDIRQPMNTILTGEQSIVNVEYSGTNADDMIGIRSKVRPLDGLGIGGKFEGGFIGLRGNVYPTGSDDYYGLVGVVEYGTGTNYGVFGAAYGGSENWGGYFLSRVYAATHLSIGNPNPLYPLEVASAQAVARLRTSTSNFGSVLELQNLNTSAPYIGAINFNDSLSTHPGQISYSNNHFMTFQTNHQARMFINGQGHVGIGTSPVYPLDIYSNQQGVVRLMTGTSGLASAFEFLQFHPAAEHLGFINFNNHLNQYPGQIAYRRDNAMTFRVKLQERMRIDSSGHVGIGTTSPDWPVDVQAPQAVVRLTTDANENGSVVELRNILTSAPYLGAINFNDSIGFYPGQIAYLNNHNLTFRIWHSERMRIDQFGRVGIGNSTPLWPLDIKASQGAIRVASVLANSGSVLELQNLNTDADYIGAINFNDSLSTFPGQIGYLRNSDLTFRVNYLERMRIDSSGRVGIGTASPLGALDVVFPQSKGRFLTTTSSEGSVLELRNNVVSPAVLGSVVFNSFDGIVPGMIQYRGDDNMLFVVRETERMRIDSMGRLGIGTASPMRTLDVHDDFATARLISEDSDHGGRLELGTDYPGSFVLGSIVFNDSESNFPGEIRYGAAHDLIFYVNNEESVRVNQNGLVGIGRIPVSNRLEVEGSAYFTTNVGFGIETPSYPVDVAASQGVARLVTTSSQFGSVLELKNNVNSPAYLGAINFNNSTNGYLGQIAYTGDNILTFRVNGSESLRINASGLMGVGRVPMTNKLEVEGTASKSSAGDWVANSDARLKANIRSLDPQEMLDKLLALKGVAYVWNDQQTGTIRPAGTQYGFTAQNVQETFPDLVETDNQGFLQTAYGTYDPMMVEAIRALNDKITVLQNENAALRLEIESMKR